MAQASLYYITVKYSEIFLMEELLNFLGSCKGFCGSAFPCHCDSWCFLHKNSGCCSDVEDVCPKPSQEFYDRNGASGLVNYLFINI